MRIELSVPIAVTCEPTLGPTGFSAVIPGYPRFSVLGDRAQGVYNLKITNASLDDDAEYQCQVGPAKLNSAIRANAKLTVICEYIYMCMRRTVALAVAVAYRFACAQRC